MSAEDIGDFPVDYHLRSATDLAAMASSSFEKGSIHDALEEAALAQNAIRRAVDSLVAEARTAGESWESIGKALHMTRQAAHEKYAHRMP